MQRFDYTPAAARILFGAGRAAELADEVRRLGCKRALVLSTPGRQAAARTLAATLDGLVAGVCAEATMHTPVEVTEKALETLRSSEADCLIALGGGSTIGLGKALALRTDLPQIALPSTYAGSEVTPILGETRAGIKSTQRSAAVLPEVVIYDVELMRELPPNVAAVSGMNAIAHAVEALYAADANPVTSLMAQEAIAVFARALPAIVADAADLAARSDALYAAWLAGTCLGSVGMALHHKLCHVLGGAFDLPHAESHAVLLPYAAAYNAPAAGEAMRRIARALNASDAVAALHALARSLGVPPSLRAIGMPEDGIEHAVMLALRDRYPNPRPLEPLPLRALLDDAFAGRPPAVH